MPQVRHLNQVGSKFSIIILPSNGVVCVVCVVCVLPWPYFTKEN